MSCVSFAVVQNFRILELGTNSKSQTRVRLQTAISALLRPTYLRVEMHTSSVVYVQVETERIFKGIY